MLDPSEARVLLGEGCFLHRAKTSNTLWVSDAPMRFGAVQLQACHRALVQAGFTVLPAPGGLWGIDPGSTRWLVQLSAWEVVPSVPFSMSKRDWAAYCLAGMLRLHPAPLTSQPLEWIRMLDQAEGNDTQFRHACERLIPQAAEALRRQEALPSAAAGLIYQHLLRSKE